LANLDQAQLSHWLSSTGGSSCGEEVCTAWARCGDRSSPHLSTPFSLHNTSYTYHDMRARGSDASMLARRQPSTRPDPSRSLAVSVAHLGSAASDGTRPHHNGQGRTERPDFGLFDPAFVRPIARPCPFPRCSAPASRPGPSCDQLFAGLATSSPNRTRASAANAGLSWFAASASHTRRASACLPAAM
jgi:hypothetical protein